LDYKANASPLHQGGLTLVNIIFKDLRKKKGFARQFEYACSKPKVKATRENCNDIELHTPRLFQYSRLARKKASFQWKDISRNIEMGKTEKLPLCSTVCANPITVICPYFY
jgi:hypothetical protein